MIALVAAAFGGSVAGAFDVRMGTGILQLPSRSYQEWRMGWPRFNLWVSGVGALPMGRTVQPVAGIHMALHGTTWFSGFGDQETSTLRVEPRVGGRAMLVDGVSVDLTAGLAIDRYEVVPAENLQARFGPLEADSTTRMGLVLAHHVAWFGDGGQWFFSYEGRLAVPFALRRCVIERVMALDCLDNVGGSGFLVGFGLRY